MLHGSSEEIRGRIFLIIYSVNYLTSSWKFLSCLKKIHDEKDIWTQKYLFNSNLDFNEKDIWTQSHIKGLPNAALNALYNLEVDSQKKQLDSVEKQLGKIFT